ncbi:MAG: peroxiredoxin [Nitrospirae bacterium]|nr:peroxiredoxin [Nitrospirota bacterium]
MPVRVGQTAPDFTLQDQNGNTVTLSQFLGHHTVVLYFYPKDDTPGCTKEACRFRDDIARFEALNARVLGVSIDGLDSHRTFAEKYRLNFPLLSDEDHRVSRAYGVFSSFAGFSYAKRTTFVIGPDGTIGRIFTDVDPNDHAAELLHYLNDLSVPSASASASEG